MSENHLFDPTNEFNMNGVDQEKDNKVADEKSMAEEYQTPKSAKHKIPIIADCPPAPEKPREGQPVNGEPLPPGLEFLESDGLEAVEVFLKSCMKNPGKFASRKRLFDASS
ncbi:unnamed protein product [Cuscuta epithymum]|uniref:Uncharacterized protein n=1 Tax=Cuscuta epithymum TaxID=186058 RepID=A0AAV0FR50_9ASTE|nr:unnamed protein product [Cuscuta epithymum]